MSAIPDIKFVLSEQETVTLTGQTIDKLIRACDGDAALLYLYILKTRGKSSTAETAAAMGKSHGEIATAMAVLSRLGLVKLGDSTETPGQDDSSEALETPPVKEPLKEPQQYSIDEIKHELKEGSEFYTLVQETQISLGKILSPDEMLRLFGIYDALRIPPEVILQLVTHCITESRGRGSGRMPSMRYIERAAYTWEREGIFSLDRAEEYLKALEARKSARGEIKKVLQIRDRELSESEKRYVDGWITMGFTPDAIDVAYDITVIKTGKLTWNYMDTIMKNWHGRNIHTLQEVPEKERKTYRNGTIGSKKTPEQKFGAPNQDDIERMQRLLNKIKET